MKLTKTTYLLIFLFSYLFANAQLDLRRYSTNAYMDELRTKPEVLEQINQIEKDYEAFLKYEEHQDFTIQIVFHVLFGNQQERIPIDKLQRQMEILNEDFGNTNPYNYMPPEGEGDWRGLEVFDELIADTRIQFCLADNIENSTFENGVNYLEAGLPLYGDFEQMKTEDLGARVVDADKYINIWICDLEGRENAGFAQMPGGPSETDGIVIDYQYLLDIDNPESEYQYGHTLTHLMGNYLGLYPLWGRGACSDDYVWDTPIHNDPGLVCQNSKRLSTCDGQWLSMMNNFMENVDDACLDMFTQGQVNRMQMALLPGGPRHGLTQNVDCTDIREITSIGIEEKDLKENLPGIRISPNPAKDFVIIESEHFEFENEIVVELFSLDGKLISRQEFMARQSIKFELPEVVPGLHILLLKSNQVSFSEKLMISDDRFRSIRN